MIRALGLKSREIVILFILEALIIGVIGAVIGSILGGSHILVPRGSRDPYASGMDVVLSLAIGLIVAVLWGLYIWHSF